MNWGGSAQERPGPREVEARTYKVKGRRQRERAPTGCRKVGVAQRTGCGQVGKEGGVRTQEDGGRVLWYQLHHGGGRQ